MLCAGKMIKNNKKCKEYSYQYYMKYVYMLTISDGDSVDLSIGRNMQKKLK